MLTAITSRSALFRVAARGAAAALQGQTKTTTAITPSLVAALQFSSKAPTAAKEDEDEDVADKMTLSGKRKHNSGADKKSSKKSKEKGIQNLNFKYLMRMVQHIGKTWGHVYREPSHEDYAWYVQVKVRFFCGVWN